MPFILTVQPLQQILMIQVIFLATQACVMLTTNIWQEVGLCNGAAATVHQLLYQADHKPPDLPIAVLVDFNNYAGLPFLSSQPNCIPILPLSASTPPTLLRDNYTQEPRANP